MKTVNSAHATTNLIKTCENTASNTLLTVRFKLNCNSVDICWKTELQIAFKTRANHNIAYTYTSGNVANTMLRLASQYDINSELRKRVRFRWKKSYDTGDFGRFSNLNVVQVHISVNYRSIAACKYIYSSDGAKSNRDSIWTPWDSIWQLSNSIQLATFTNRLDHIPIWRQITVASP